MSKKSTSLAVLLCLLAAGTAVGQDSTYNFTVQTLGGYTTPGVVPFWLRSNQFGSIPLDGASLSFIGAARKDYDMSGDKLFDWGASFEGRANLGQGSNLTLIEGYGKVRLGIFELRAGRSKEITGLCDTTLSSGSFSISGSSLGIPKIEVAVREFYTVPGLGQLFAFKGNFAHGWMGGKEVRVDGQSQDTAIVSTFLHQKTLYARFGKPSWKIKLYGGFNHQVMFGDENDIYSHDYTLLSLQAFYYVMIGKRYNNGDITGTRVGDHVGSIDLGLEYNFDNLRVFLYRQNFYEAGALAHLANIQDGLNGISFEKPKDKKNQGLWNKIVFEFLYTKSQARELWLPTPMHYENYFNHYLYIKGWSYYGKTVGTPFIASRDFSRSELPSSPNDYFLNNRLVAFNIACQGSVKEYYYTLKASWSRNYGTYFTATIEEQSELMGNPGAHGFFGEQDQLSTYLEVNRRFTNGLNLCLIAASDIGELYYNSFGLFLKASYSFHL